MSRTRELVALYRLTQPARNPEPYYDLAPTMTVGVVVPAMARRVGVDARLKGIGGRTRLELGPADYES